MCSIKKAVLTNFAIFTGKHLKPCNYCEIFKNSYFEKHVQTAASGDFLMFLGASKGSVRKRREQKEQKITNEYTR